jgi:phosphoglycerol transferase
MIVLLPSAVILIALGWFAVRAPMGRGMRSLHFVLGLVGVLSLWLFSASHEFSGEGINLAVIYHLSANLVGAGYGEFKFVIIRQVLLLLGGVGFWIWACRKRTAVKAVPRAGVLLLASWVSFWALNPTVWAGVRLAPVLMMKQERRQASGDWAVAHRKLGLAKPGQPRGSPPIRNLVWVYAESLERTYFDEKLFPGLLPELKKLADEALDFTDIQSVEGTTWTIGGIAGSQCGLPLISGMKGLDTNDHGGIGNFFPGAYCLSDHLALLGYRLHFLGGADSNFAGKGLFFESHNFNEVGDLKSLRRWVGEPRSSWGLYDDRIFEISRERFAELSGKGDPFALVTLTVDTHHPVGHATPSCQGLNYGDGSNRMLNSVHCADRLISDYVRHIRSRDTRGETLVVVSSDHLAMPNAAYPLLNQGRRRDLLLAFAPGQSARRIDKVGATIDAGSTVLELMGHENPNIGLGKSLLGAEKTLVETQLGLSGANQWLVSRAEDFRGLWALPRFPKGELWVDPLRKRVAFDGVEFNFPLLMVAPKADEVIETLFNDRYKKGHLANLFRELKPGKQALWIDECARMGPAAVVPRESRFCLTRFKPSGMASVMPLKRLAPISMSEVEKL